MPWEKRHSGLKGAAESNFLWAHGFSPFGPFGNSTSFSQINVDQIMMNNYISRLGASVHRVGQALLSMDAFADTYLFDPLGEEWRTTDAGPGLTAFSGARQRSTGHCPCRTRLSRSFTKTCSRSKNRWRRAPRVSRRSTTKGCMPFLIRSSPRPLRSTRMWAPSSRAPSTFWVAAR